ncbi:MAG: hypothetical protein IK058_00410 [Bacteroidales bacterium]|nr:hypothetical protein [Bacteroidales bacterium]
MKVRRLIIGYLIPALIVLVSVVWLVWCHTHPRQLPLGQCSEELRRYRKVDGIQASYLKSFPLNDTLTVAVTLLQATDSAGWSRLLEDFGLDYVDSDAVREMRKIKTTSTYLMYPKGRPGQPPDSLVNANNLLVCSFYLHEISIFDLESEAHVKVIMKYKYNDNRKKVLTNN